jgi:putative transposase
MATPKPQKYVPVFFMSSATMAAMTNLTDDGLTQWHPAFLQLGNNLEDCARKYRGFCKRYNPKSKPARKCNWGNKLLAGLDLKGGKRSGKPQTLTASSAPPTPPTPSSPPHPDRCQVSESQMVSAIATQFIPANQAPRRESRQF